GGREWRCGEGAGGREAGEEMRSVGQIYDGEAIALVARGLATQTRVLDVVIYAPTGSGWRVDVWGAKASYGVHALNANLKLERVTINGANGANGARGGDGTDAPTLGATAAMGGCPYTARCPNDH